MDKDGESVSLVDVIEMDNKETLDTMILKQDVKELYEAFEACLTETEKTVLGMRYGLYRGKEHTQREIAGNLAFPAPMYPESKRALLKNCVGIF